MERSEHSFDPFPDSKRVLPWGVGCSIAYNYVDLVVRNDTATTFQLRTWVGERHLRLPPQRDLAHDVREGNRRRGRRECVKRNVARVLYVPEESRVRDLSR